ncbi:MAG: hypothetical protein IPI60_16625, partial [Saprospiraceae bacterium]|nr:hypothetical protein [Saprospiraceae bacterium]
MCGLSKAELPDVFVTAPDRQDGEPSSASFNKTDVRTLIEGFPNANIEIALNDSGEDPNLEMWAIDENNNRVNGPIIAEFPCPRRCFDQHGMLLPRSLFCNRDLQSVLDHDGSN